ncbi:MAG: hypothetical protein ABI333_24340 [bacterium]
MFDKIALVLGPALACLGGLIGWLLALRRRHPEGGFGSILAIAAGVGGVTALLAGTLLVIIVPSSARITGRFICRPGSTQVIETIQRTDSTEYVDRCVTRDARRQEPSFPSWLFLLLLYGVPLVSGACLIAAQIRWSSDKGRGPPELSALRYVTGGIFLLGVAGVTTLVGLTDFSASPPAHPPSLGAKPGCTLWVGTAPGKLKGLRIELLLCAQGGDVTGVAQWSGRRIGWSRRALSGRWDEQTRTFELRDTKFQANHPGPNVRHCLVEGLTLTRGADDTLTGPYFSQKCRDKGHMVLRRVGPVPAAPGKQP